MAGPKMIYVTLPKPLPPGAQIKGVYSTERGFIAKRQMSSTISPTILKFIKEEPLDVEIVVGEEEDDDDDKSPPPPRKRQKLDHLSFDQKLMRRKLKNRVAAQTARDRKKVRMDELEDKVSELSDKVTTLSAVVASLSDHNSKLEQEKDVLERRASQCTCCRGGDEKGSAWRTGDKAPVGGVTVKSAELPQPRAVTLRAAAWRALFLSLICVPSKSPLRDAAETRLRQLDRRGVTLARPLLRELSTWKSSRDIRRWMDHHQPPWVVAR